MNLMFVCTGNTCRSPMAEFIMRKLLAEKGLTGWTVSSVGLAAFNGQAAALPAIKVLKRVYDIDLSLHRSSAISVERAEAADYILTMTKEHADLLREYLPEEIEVPIFPLTEFVNGEQRDIGDPYGGNEYMYEAVALDLQELLQQLIEKLSVETEENDY